MKSPSDICLHPLLRRCKRSKQLLWKSPCHRWIASTVNKSQLLGQLFWVVGQQALLKDQQTLFCNSSELFMYVFLCIWAQICQFCLFGFLFCPFWLQIWIFCDIVYSLILKFITYSYPMKPFKNQIYLHKWHSTGKNQKQPGGNKGKSLKNDHGFVLYKVCE